MKNDIDLSNTSLEFPDVECGSDIEAGPNIICLSCQGICASCEGTCKRCHEVCKTDWC